MPLLDRDLKGSTYFSAIWLSLIVIFICALTPVESVQTRWVGSAFDPSTTAVALRGRSDHVLRADETVLKDRAASSDRAASPAFHPFILLDCIAFLLIASASAARGSHPVRGRVKARASASAHRARAPPAR